MSDHRTSSPRALRRLLRLPGLILGIVAFLLGLPAAGCGAATPRLGSSARPIPLEELRIVAREGEDGELRLGAYDARDLFARGARLQRRGRCEDAVALYDQLHREFPSSRYLGPSLYNAGLCLQGEGQSERSVGYYRELIERLPESRDARHAAFQVASLLIRMERWEDAIAVAEGLLTRRDLAPDERLEALARRAQALFGAGRVADAERQARDALTYYRTRRGDERIADEYFAAAANFVLAETIRHRSESLELPEADVATQHEILENRARLLLEAQREYFNTIRHTNAEWAAAAGFRIGSLYEGLWHAIRRGPIPPPSERIATPEARAIYERSYRSQLMQRIRPLLRHAIQYWELTLLMGERTGVRTEWLDRTRADLERMRATLLESNRPAPSGGADGAEAPLEGTEAASRADRADGRGGAL